MAAECVSTAPTNAAGQAATSASKAGRAAAVTRYVKELPSMPMTEIDVPAAKPGSVPVMMSEIRYGIVFGEMNEVFYARMNALMWFIGLVCAGLTAGGLLTQVRGVAPDAAPWWSLLFGVLAVLAGAAKVAFRLKERSEEFRKARSRFQELEGRGWSMNQSTLQKELKKLLSDAPSGGGWLASAAFNKACEELGYPEVRRPVPPHVRFLAARVT